MSSGCEVPGVILCMWSVLEECTDLDIFQEIALYFFNLEKLLRTELNIMRILQVANCY